MRPDQGSHHTADFHMETMKMNSSVAGIQKALKTKKNKTRPVEMILFVVLRVLCAPVGQHHTCC